MKNHAKKAVISTKKFVNDHKVGITFIATAALCLRLNKFAVRQHDDFLKEHDLYDEFYLGGDEEPAA